VTALPDRQFFKIGEAAEIVGVKTHVLRYWETEFPSIRPLKTRGAHRMYRRADVELLCVIHKLLHHEGYTIAGARKRVRELRRAQRAAPSTQTAGESKLSVPLGALGEPSATQQAGVQQQAHAETAREFSVLQEDAQDPGVLRDAASGLGLLKEETREHGLWNEASRELGLRAELIQLRRELTELMREIDQLASRRAPAPEASATVTAVVPKTVLIAQRKQLR
jgi:DNA-binding transcriptional MerR regulator